MTSKSSMMICNKISQWDFVMLISNVDIFALSSTIGIKYEVTHHFGLIDCEDGAFECV